jgi:prephenate dehydratase
MDFLGHRTDMNVINGLEAAREHCLQLSILGSFPKAKEML